MSVLSSAKQYPLVGVAITRVEPLLTPLYSFVDRDQDGKVSLGDLAGATVAATNIAIKNTKAVVNNAYQVVLGKTQDAVDYVLPQNNNNNNHDADNDNNNNGSNGLNGINKKGGDNNNENHVTNGTANNIDSLHDGDNNNLNVDEDPVLTLSSIRQAVSARLKERAFSAASNGYAEIKKISANRVEPIIHVDPVVYTETIVHTQIEPIVSKLQEQIHFGIDSSRQQVKQAVEAFSQAANLAKETASNTAQKAADAVGVNQAISMVSFKAAEVKEAVHQRASSAVPEAIKKAGPEITQRFQAIKTASIELAAQTKDHAIHAGITELPADAIQIIANLPNVLLFSPALNREQDPTGLLTKVEELLAAVKGLFWWSAAEQQVLSAKEKAKQLASAAVAKKNHLKPNTNAGGNNNNNNISNRPGSGSNNKKKQIH